VPVLSQPGFDAAEEMAVETDQKRNLFEPAGRVISLPVSAGISSGTPKGQRPCGVASAPPRPSKHLKKTAETPKEPKSA
jgi:hypothetical protein